MKNTIQTTHEYICSVKKLHPTTSCLLARFFVVSASSYFLLLVMWLMMRKISVCRNFNTTEKPPNNSIKTFLYKKLILQSSSVSIKQYLFKLQFVRLFVQYKHSYEFQPEEHFSPKMAAHECWLASCFSVHFKDTKSDQLFLSSFYCK